MLDSKLFIVSGLNILPLLPIEKLNGANVMHEIWVPDDGLQYQAVSTPIF